LYISIETLSNEGNKMPIDEAFISKMSDNPLIAENEIINRFFKIMQFSTMNDDKSIFYEELVEIFSFYQVYSEKTDLDVSFPKLGSTPEANIELVTSFFKNRHRIINKKFIRFNSEKIILEKKMKFKALLNNEFIYIMTGEEVNRIQRHLSEVQKYIVDNIEIDRAYRLRLQRRIDFLNKDLKIEINSLDPYWALVGDAGVIVGKLRDKAKPIVENITEIVNIIWHLQARTEELASATPVMNLSYKAPDIE
jgi:hypothetical protein